MKQENHPPSHASRATERRHPSRRIIQVALAASVMSSILLVGGFTYGTYAALGGTIRSSSPQTYAPSTAAAQKPAANQTKTLHLVALGDSLAHGLGDASGNGFVGDVSQLYRGQGYAVIQSNFGIDGLTSAGLLDELKQSSINSVLASANVILVSIGGNDLNDAAGLPKINKTKIAAAEQQFISNLTTILTQIRSVNQSAPILLVGLYNPYEDVAASKIQTDSVVQSFDTAEEAVTAKFQKVVVAQTFDLFQLHGNQLLYVDHFHPNQTGYQRIANRIWQDLQGA